MSKKNVLTVFVFMMILSFVTSCDDTSKSNGVVENTSFTPDVKSDTVFSLTDSSHYNVCDMEAGWFTYDIRYTGAMEYEPSHFYDTSVFSTVYSGWYSSTGEGFRALRITKSNPNTYSIVHNIEFIYEGQKIVSKMVQLGSGDILNLINPKARPDELPGIDTGAVRPDYVWIKNSTQASVKWARGGRWNGENVSIWLYNAQSRAKFLVTSSTLNDGKYDWKVSGNVPYSAETESFSWQVKIMKPVEWMSYGDNTLFLNGSNSTVENFFAVNDNLFSTSVDIRITN